jgi:hypothetical protein
MLILKKHTLSNMVKKIKSQIFVLKPILRFNFIETFFHCFNLKSELKGLSQKILGPVYWLLWMHLGLNKIRIWF